MVVTGGAEEGNPPLFEVMCVIMDWKIISTTKEEDDEGLRNGWDEPYKD